MATVVLVLGLVLGIVGSVALAAWFLWMGAGWAKIENVSYRRALAAMLLVGVVGLVVQSAELVAPVPFERFPVGAPLVQLLIVLVCTWLLLQWILRTTFGRAILAWLPTLAATVIIFALALGVVRPFLLEAYAIPTNAMAPTLLGDHLLGVCPACGGVLIVPQSRFDAGEEFDADFDPSDQLGICRDCLHAGNGKVTDEKRYGGDRILALKLLEPRRWDIVVFRYPGDQSVTYAMRLVGLPGETVAVKDGDVWINGRREPKPEEIAKLVYTGDPLRDPEADWGPVQLGDDEYFVLGDFSLLSSDSRVWPVGAEGHPRYAVPESCLVGVVSHVYWPLSRLRAFR